MLLTDDGGSPRCHDPGGYALGVDQSVVGPVHHVVGRDDHERVDGLVTIGWRTSLILLMVIGTVDIEATVVLDGCRVGNVVEVQQRVGPIGAQLER